MNNDLTTFFTSNFTIDELEQVLSETIFWLAWISANVFEISSE
jgi:hypothetical protein